MKFTGVLDTGNIVEVPALELVDTPASDTGLVLTGYRLDMLEYSIGPGIEVVLEWDGTNPQQIFALSGRGHIEARNYGGFIPDMTRAGYTGNINLRTRNFIPSLDGAGVPVIQNFTVVLELIKLYRR